MPNILPSVTSEPSEHGSLHHHLGIVAILDVALPDGRARLPIKDYHARRVRQIENGEITIYYDVTGAPTGFCVSRKGPGTPVRCVHELVYLDGNPLDDRASDWSA